MPTRLHVALLSLSLGGCGAPGPVATQAPGQAPDGMVWVPGGSFTMGSEGEHAAPDERPVHRVEVDGFYMDARPVTNAAFQRFVDATGYRTVAERPVTAEELLAQMPPGTPPPAPEVLVPGSLVFAPATERVSLADVFRWWAWVPGASWRHPTGPARALGPDDAALPVVQIAWDDAVAYATWRGGRLPTEAEWERAARGGLEGAEYAWGDAPLDRAHPQAHTYTGVFPTQAAGPVPVGAFPPNGYGLYDMAGNVWEWTGDWYAADTYAREAERGVARDPTGAEAPNAMGARVLRGGSYLCNDAYCRGYRVSARSSAASDSGASHIGFRIILTVSQWQARTGAAR